MINYSVFLLKNPQDLSQPAKAYARAQVKEVMSFRQFVAHIAEHGGHPRGQVKGVLSDMCKCLVEQLLEGKKIMLDELGEFWLTLSSEGAATCDAFTARNITGVRIVFTPGVDFENLLNRADFNLVASRRAQAATLKAQKAGSTTADWSEMAVEDGGEDDGGNTPSGGGSTAGGNGSASGSGSGSDSTAGGSGSDSSQTGGGSEQGGGSADTGAGGAASDE